MGPFIRVHADSVSINACPKRYTPTKPSHAMPILLPCLIFGVCCAQQAGSKGCRAVLHTSVVALHARVHVPVVLRHAAHWHHR